MFMDLKNNIVSVANFLNRLSSFSTFSEKKLYLKTLISSEIDEIKSTNYKDLGELRLQWKYERGLIAGSATALFSFFILAGLMPDAQTVNAILSFDHFLSYVIGGFSALIGVLAYIYAAHPGHPIIHLEGMDFKRNYLGTQQKFEELEGRQIKIEAKRGAIPGLKLGQFIQISRQREVGHISVNGVPGGGKTVLFKYLLEQIVRHGDRLLIHDPKGDYSAFLTQLMYNPNAKANSESDTSDFEKAQAVIFGPWDDRSVWWDIGADITDPQLAQTFAKTLFPTVQGDSAFWSDAARELMGAAISYLIKTKGTWYGYRVNEHGEKVLVQNKGAGWGWNDLAELISSGADKIIDAAKQADPNIELLIAKKVEGSRGGADEKLKQNILATIASKIGWILPYARSNEFDPASRFSITEWLKAEPRYANLKTVILQNNLTYSARAEQVFTAMMSAFQAYVCSADMPEISADQPGYYMLLDEYPQLGTGVSDVVKKTMELARSRGVRVIFAYQDESQLDAIFGAEEGRVQRSLQQVKVYCKSDRSTAKNLAQSLGDKRVIKVTDRMQSAKLEQQRQEVNIPVARSDDFTGLKIVGKSEGSDDSRATGAEIAVFCDDVGGKAIVSFTEMQDIRPKTITSYRWQYGLFTLGMFIEGIKQGKGLEQMHKSASEIEKKVDAAVDGAINNLSSSLNIDVNVVGEKLNQDRESSSADADNVFKTYEKAKIEGDDPKVLTDEEKRINEQLKAERKKRDEQRKQAMQENGGLTPLQLRKLERERKAKQSESQLQNIYISNPTANIVNDEADGQDAKDLLDNADVNPEQGIVVSKNAFD